MYRKDFSDLEDQIMDTVKNALNAINFASITRDIASKTDETINEFKTKLKEYNNKIENRYTNLNKSNKKDITLYIEKKPAGTVAGILYIIFGSIGSFVFGILLAVFSIVTTVVPDMLGGGLVGLGVIAAFFASSLGVTINGINIRKRIRRFKKYVNFLDDNTYCLINDLARIVGKKEKFVIKDLRKMIDLNMFKEGHIDDEETHFMLTNEVYENYLNLKRQQNIKKHEKDKLENKSRSNEEENDKVNTIINTGRNYIEEIKNVKNQLYKEEFSLKLGKLQNIVNQILNYIEKNPKKLNEVNKFINHYLPMTIKLINSYKELNNQPVQGDNIKKAKIEIEKSIDLINTAFENLLDDLYEDMALDISTDISVLKTLFKQEGLTENDFEK
ncbi:MULTISPECIES: 5-bromo-4-chloroindolyl phosphate hydrolysis family protein [Eubacteriales]|uniref:5-bromo-4-chloroindolyl phosphate hydrolysis protein n=1 Tax=Clostridium isatidis TaxID=182773 RepID=A0A343JCS1_9CLOT|nr:MULTISPECIES: 5-bromo-4-chloroindolyl phosphate hydrolysis family protein [Eubacteriales]ASW43329.1 5-bromo-4-chloroindolyl phosphate hydrolysis protein [Clostridium isatidis]MBU5454950.1 5-bromo-4-chloroindolyl phosphate hydrolysis family protein [Caproiciproducens sp. MSJ-32]